LKYGVPKSGNTAIAVTFFFPLLFFLLRSARPRCHVRGKTTLPFFFGGEGFWQSIPFSLFFPPLPWSGGIRYVQESLFPHPLRRDTGKKALKELLFFLFPYSPQPSPPQGKEAFPFSFHLLHCKGERGGSSTSGVPPFSPPLFLSSFAGLDNTCKEFLHHVTVPPSPFYRGSCSRLLPLSPSFSSFLPRGRPRTAATPLSSSLFPRRSGFEKL